VKQIAIYGKGGIGKSTITANLSAALGDGGRRVMQIGCDPKQDSTRLLMNGKMKETVLDCLRRGDQVKFDGIVGRGYGDVLCVEAGGPEPGVGCAGRGIMATLEVLRELGLYNGQLDFIFYDVLGDVVCGGFAMPMRRGFAQEVYIVTSGEYMALYAANNICRGLVSFASRGGALLAGIIGNGRGLPDEEKTIAAFAQGVGSQMAAFVPQSSLVQEGERACQTVIEYAPESLQAEVYRQLAKTVANGQGGVVPRPLSPSQLEDIIRRTP
jgi:nitrogenase iron protein NifH